MVRRGDRFRFYPNYSKPGLSSQTVTVTKVIDDDRFWCCLLDEDDVETEVLCRDHEVPGYGLLEGIQAADSKQHDQITLEQWRQKARSPNWPRGS